MTVIVWDGKTLAADKRAVSQGYFYNVTKIRKINGSLFGISGYANGIPTIAAWLENGADPSKWPEIQKDKERWCEVLIVTPDKKILKYEQEPLPFEVEEIKHAIGSGRDYALAAMEMGADAVKAVEIASKFDSGCGNGVDSISFD